GSAAQEHDGIERRELSQRNVNMRHARRVVSVRLDVAGDADDRYTLETATESELQLLSDRIGVRPILPRQFLITASDGTRFIRIEIAEVAAGSERHLHRLEIMCIDDGDVRDRLMCGISGPAGNRKGRIVSS